MYRNSIKGAPKDEYTNLTTHYKQKSNRKVLGGLMYVDLYNFGKLFYDTAHVSRKKEKIIKKINSKIEHTSKESRKDRLTIKKEKKIKRKNLTLVEGNAFMRTFGEPPEILDTSKVENTVLDFKAYLFSKGYFNNKVKSEIKKHKRKSRVSVKYTIDAGAPFVIKSIQYQIDDSRIDSLVNNSSIYSKKIKQGENYDESKLTDERESIYKLLKDNGYFNFQRHYILYEVDSIKEPNKVFLKVIIEKKHDVYRLSKLIYNMNDVQSKYNIYRDTFLYRNVYYVYTKKTYLRKLLDYKISTRPYDIFSQSKLQKTQSLLGSMDMYKFVNINLIENKEDTVNHTLTAYINTQPLDKFQISQEYGMSVGQALIPGPFLSFTLKTRNIFRWLEVIENTFRYSFEAQYNTSNSDVYRAREFSATTAINLSQLLFPSKLRDIMKNYYPKVKFYTGYNFVIRPEFRRETFRAGLTYHYTRNAYSSFYLTPIEVNLIDSKVTTEYGELLRRLNQENGSNLYLSFNPSIVTDFQFSYIYNNHDFNATKITKFFRPSLEFGGLVPSIVSNIVEKNKDTIEYKLFNKQIFEYLRLGLDVRYYMPVKKNNIFVVRFNMGYAQPLGISNKQGFFALPYEKYFFSGGNSSIRAWKPRRLGLGVNSENAEDNYLYEQPGEILFETNYEYRFKVISMINWAFFVDAGNVWSIRNEKEGAQFKWNSAISQIAVGAGMGLRLDFSFLILRLDVANKVIDPAQPEGSRFVGKVTLRNSVWNFGIGYPF